MSIGDKFNELKDKATDALGQHSDQVDKGMEKGKQFASEKTGGKYDDQINKGADALRNRMGQGDDNAQR